MGRAENSSIKYNHHIIGIYSLFQSIFQHIALFLSLVFLPFPARSCNAGSPHIFQINCVISSRIPSFKYYPVWQLLLAAYRIKWIKLRSIAIPIPGTAATAPFSVCCCSSPSSSAFASLPVSTSTSAVSWFLYSAGAALLLLLPLLVFPQLENFLI